MDNILDFKYAEKISLKEGTIGIEEIINIGTGRKELGVVVTGAYNMTIPLSKIGYSRSSIKDGYVNYLSPLNHTKEKHPYLIIHEAIERECLNLPELKPKESELSDEFWPETDGLSMTYNYIEGFLRENF